MKTQWLLGWWTLVFLVPFSLALLYLGLYVVCGVAFGVAVRAGVAAGVGCAGVGCAGAGGCCEPARRGRPSCADAPASQKAEASRRKAATNAAARGVLHARVL